MNRWVYRPETDTSGDGWFLEPERDDAADARFADELARQDQADRERRQRDQEELSHV